MRCISSSKMSASVYTSRRTRSGSTYLVKSAMRSWSMRLGLLGPNDNRHYLAAEDLERTHRHRRGQVAEGKDAQQIVHAALFHDRLKLLEDRLRRSRDEAHHRALGEGAERNHLGPAVLACEIVQVAFPGLVGGNAGGHCFLSIL